MLVKKKFAVLAMSETKLKGKGECKFGVSSRRKQNNSGVVDIQTLEGVVMLLRDLMAKSVTV